MMERRIISETAAVIFVVNLAIFVGGCYNDVSEVLYPECDLSNVTYNNTIKPILERECYDCHAGFSPDAGLDLEGYTNARNAMLTEAYRAGLIYRLQYDTVPRMPYYLPKLDTCTIAKFKAWEKAGFPEN